MPAILRMLGSLQLGRKETEKKQLITKWGEEVREASRDREYVPLPEYPRPQMKRDNIKILNGWWDYAFTELPKGAARKGGTRFPAGTDRWEAEGKILVPFSPETQLSGVGRRLMPDELLYYRRTFELPDAEEGRFLLHFGAVDQECCVYINGRKAGHHMGGYLPFTVDLTGFARTGENALEVRVRDVSDTLYHAKGKQTLSPGGMYYTAQSGIWQTVWLERVPRIYIRSMEILPDIDREEVKVTLHADGSSCEEDFDASLGVLAGGDEVSEARIRGTLHPGDNCISLTARVPDCRLWSPEDPYLYGLSVKLTAGNGTDSVTGYAGMRAFTVEEDAHGHTRFCLNHRPYFLNGVLDQGYWPDGLYTPPATDAFEFDIRNMKELGFNFARKHAKIEPLTWYECCDRLGFIVFQDMVNGGEAYSTMRVTYLPTVFPGLQKMKGWSAEASGRKDREGREEFVREVRSTVRLLKSVPSLGGWTLFNEGWGQFGAAHLTNMIRRLDGTRPIDSASGWFDGGEGDFISVHNYFRDLTVPKERIKKARKRAAFISEYGGMTLNVPGHTESAEVYGYDAIASKDEFAAKFRRIMAEIAALEKKGLSGAVYTQVSDIEEETNGLLTYDRRVRKV